jgi:RNA methyltransferase, TrmH family
LRRPDLVVELFATAAAGQRHAELIETARAAGLPVDEISPKAAAALSETVTPQGIVAVCHHLTRPLEDVLAERPTLVATLVEPSDPGNAGTILRTADAAGVGAVIFAGGGVDPYNGKCVRASAGSLFHLDVVIVADLGELLSAASAAGLQTLATTGSAATEVDDIELAGPTLWLFGNEAHGLPTEVLTAATTRVKVPIYGRAESLNLAAAAAVCLYASARAQRAAKPEPTGPA